MSLRKAAEYKFINLGFWILYSLTWNEVNSDHDNQHISSENNNISYKAFIARVDI